MCNRLASDHVCSHSLAQKQFQDFPGHPKLFSRMLYTACAVVNLLYMVSSTANTLDQVHCIQRCNTQMHYVWNSKYFKIYFHCVSASKSPNLAQIHIGQFEAQSKIQGLSRTILIFPDFPGHENFWKINHGLSRIFQDGREPAQPALEPAACESQVRCPANSTIVSCIILRIMMSVSTSK